MRVGHLLAPDFEQLLREAPAQVREVLDEVHPEDVAEIVGEWDDEKASALLMELPPDYAAEVFERLDEERQTALAERMGLGSTVRIIGEMSADDRADFFEELDDAEADRLLEALARVDPEVAQDVKDLTKWPDTSAGGLMTTDYWSIGAEQTLADAILEVRHNVDEADAVDAVWVEGKTGRLVGYLTLPDLLLNKPEKRVVDVVRSNYLSVPPELDQEEVARFFSKYDVMTLPVVGAKGELLGIITPDDVMDVIAEEQDEDVQKMGAIAPIEDDYLRASLRELVAKRAIWLLVLFAGGFLTTWAMQSYDDVLARATQLAVFVPLLIAAGGNSGSQSSTLIIRGLSTGDIRARDWWRVLLKELSQGLVLGGLLALAGVLRVLAFGGEAAMAGLVGASLISIVIMGCVVGGMMPLVLHRLGVDPATSSTPFIATLVDVLGIVIYLSLAQWLLLAALSATPG